MSKPESDPALSFDDVSVVRGRRLIWSEGTFSVPAGGITAVIGSNGSGKTTLLQVVLGLLRVASGTVRVLGRPPGQATELIGYVPQNYAAAAGNAIRASDAVMLGLIGNRWGFARPTAAERPCPCAQPSARGDLVRPHAPTAQGRAGRSPEVARAEPESSLR